MSQIKCQHGSYPDLVGRRSIFCGAYTGPASYVTGGDPITAEQFGYYIDSLQFSASVSGTYVLRTFPSIAGPRATWKVKWIVISSGLEVAATTNLSGETSIASGFGGLY